MFVKNPSTSRVLFPLTVSLISSLMYISTAGVYLHFLALVYLSALGYLSLVALSPSYFLMYFRTKYSRSGARHTEVSSPESSNSNRPIFSGSSPISS